MPARSKAQQELMAIAEHAPSKLYARNAGLLKMSHQQLHDFAATKRKGLPQHTKAGSSGPKPGRFPKPGRPVKTTPQAAANQWAPPVRKSVKRAPFGGKAAPLFRAKAAKTPKERYPDAHAMDWRDNQ